VVAKAAHCNYDRGMMLTGLRGVGKTALLNHVRGHADEQGWFTVQMEAQATTAGSRVNYKQLAHGLKQGLRRYSRHHQITQLAEKLASILDGSSLSVAGFSITAPTPDESDIISVKPESENISPGEHPVHRIEAAERRDTARVQLGTAR